ncbi:MAG: YwiC-like family protein [Candidatus Promineifilaceae bacterium]
MPARTETTKKKHSPFRKHLLLPAEHGTWFWFFVPFFVGVGVARVLNAAVLLTFIGGFAAFLMRHPLTMWFQIRRGRGRKTDSPQALRWATGLGLVAITCFVLLLAMGLIPLLWLLLPLIPLVIFYLIAAQKRRAASRTFWVELAGAVGLALMAPTAYIAATGQMNSTGWLLWGLMAGQNALGVHYVRLRLADTHSRRPRRLPVLWSHGVGLLAVVLAGIQGLVPLMTAVPFIAFLVRGLWVTIRPRPVTNVRRFGLTEVAIEIISGLWMITAY